MKQTTLFRVAVVSLVLAGALALYLATFGRHGPPHDDGTTPKVPTTEPDGSGR